MAFYRSRELSPRRRLRRISGVTRSANYETSSELSLGNRSLSYAQQNNSVEQDYSSPRSSSFEIYPGE